MASAVGHRSARVDQPRGVQERGDEPDGAVPETRQRRPEGDALPAGTADQPTVTRNCVFGDWGPGADSSGPRFRARGAEKKPRLRA